MKQKEVMREKIVKLDVRDEISRGREPFAKIMLTVSNLRQNEKLLLIAPFKPAPLYAIMAQRGFLYEEKSTTEGAWEVLFTTNAKKTSESKPTSHHPHEEETRCACGCGRKVLDVDARGMEPPQPLVKILEALTDLPHDTEVKAHTDRRPLHLYAHLDERGFAGRTEEQKDGSFVTFVHRCDPLKPTREKATWKK